MSDLPLFTRTADERIAELEAKLAAAEAAFEAEREKVRVLRMALEKLAGVAVHCDGWESFPSIEIDKAYEALAITEDV